MQETAVRDLLVERKSFQIICKYWLNLEIVQPKIQILLLNQNLNSECICSKHRQLWKWEVGTVHFNSKEFSALMPYCFHEKSCKFFFFVWFNQSFNIITVWQINLLYRNTCFLSYILLHFFHKSQMFLWASFSCLTGNIHVKSVLTRTTHRYVLNQN